MAGKHDDSWTNDRIIEFIQNYKTEPILWDPEHPYHKKKLPNYEAWLRIKDNMSWHVTVQELKRKMASLMEYYRAHINKHNKSLQGNSGAKEPYHIIWFAFSAMNSFLHRVYGCKLTNTDHSENIETITDKNEENERICFISSESQTTKELRSKTSGGTKRSRDESPQSIPATRTGPQTEPAFEYVYGNVDDEYDTFGKLIASKLKKIRNDNTREVVMNDIHNLIFRACVMDQQEQQERRSQHVQQSTAAQAQIASDNTE